MATTVVMGSVQEEAKGVFHIKWSATVSGDGSIHTLPPHVISIDVQVSASTFGTSRVIIKGSNQDTPSTAVYETMTSVTGQAMDYTGAQFKVMNESPRYIKPLFDTVTSGATIKLDIYVRSGVA
mgnify:CR=1 FL=1|jgi:hypothetical protein|tara:strand:+ start:4376 stop:4747 length:372 start_codon:yes stop_codon:yes gene_type:complete